MSNTPTTVTNPLKQTVETQFSTRPNLRSVVTQMLADNLKEKYPTLTLPVSDLRLALPRDRGGRDLHPLLTVALEYLAAGNFPDVSSRLGTDAYLSDAIGNRLTFQSNGSHVYDLTVISSVIHELPLILFIAFQDALTAYWGQASDAGGSRWQWLAGILRGQLRASAIRQSAGDTRALQTLTALADYPARETRNSRPRPDNSIRAYIPQAQLVRGKTRLTLQSSDVLVVGGKQVLLCSVAGQVRPYADLDAFGEAWSRDVAQRFVADTITWQLYEPDGNIFEVQAALILNQQLDDLAAIELPGTTTPIKLEELFESVTDAARQLDQAHRMPRQTLSSIQAALPTWLRNASPSDRFAYRQCLLEQASARHLDGGKTWLEGLEDIRTYAASHLDHQLCLDRHNALHGKRECKEELLKYRADKLELTFHVPVGTLQSGYVEQVHMSLVDLALKNLSGQPKGRMTLRDTDEQAIEAWLTPEYVLQLVQRVDIGRNYPTYIRQALLSETENAEQRKRQFIAQRPVQLKTQALEHQIKNEAGLTQRGFQCVRAVVASNHAGRHVNNDEIVMRPLAFQRRPGAKADKVLNMFIIEPRNVQSGPHLLYRPAYRQSLLEFPSRDSLLAAIVESGALQDSVLAWLADSARAIYSNGGFTQPHYARIGGVGSEFDPLPEVPKPATLAGADDECGDEILLALANGTLLEFLFVSEARQLVEQGDRESTSNAESRWALILEGAQLGFNTLLMLVRGPLATVGWFVQLVQGLTQDLPALESNDPIARELAWVDLLLNTAMVLVHNAVSSTQAERSISVDDSLDRARARLPFRRPIDQAERPLPSIKRGAFGLPSEPPGGGRTLLDFDRSLASDSAAARLLEKLTSVNVRWPVPTPEPVAIGPWKGLYKIDNRWHASVGGLLFQVSVVPGFGEVYIIHPEKPDHPGIKLKTDGNGHWTLDRGLKLSGGGPKRLQALREENRRKTEELVAQMQALSADIAPRMEAYMASAEQMTNVRQDLKKQATELTLIWKLLQKVSDDKRPALAARHLQAMQAYATLRVQYEILLENLKKQFEPTMAVRLELVEVGKALKKFAGAGAHVQELPKILKTIFDQQTALHIYETTWVRTLFMTLTGEPMTALSERMYIGKLFGDSALYNEYVTRSVELADGIERLAGITQAMLNTLDQLEQVSAGGRGVRQELLKDIAYPQAFFPENLKLRTLIPLSWATVLIDSSLPPQESFYVKRMDQADLGNTVLSHIEVRSSADYPLAEQRDVYESVLDKYRQYESALLALKTLDPNRLNPVSERLLEGLQYARKLAANELEAVVRAQEQLQVELPLSKNLRPKAPTKRVFKTHHKHYLIGDLKPASASSGGEHYEIVDPLSGNTITSFEQRADGWTSTQEPLETPAPAPTPARPLTMLKTLGQGLVKERVDVQRVIEAQQPLLASPATQESIDPGSWDKSLTGLATKLTELADEIARGHLDKPSANGLVDEFRAQARDMQREAQRVCSAAYKQQWPTQESLDYLWRHGEIDINLTSRADPQRPTLSGDFFTEYAVYDKAQKPPAVLWYAHFHYATADASPADYTRAHLKLAAQRKYTQKDLLKDHVQASLREQQAPGAEPVRKILYTLVTPPVDQVFLTIAPSPAPR